MRQSEVVYHTEVTAGGYIVISAQGEKPVAIARRVGPNIAITIYDPLHKKAALALAVSTAGLHRMFNEFPDYKNRNRIEEALVVRLVGGNDSDKSRQMVLKLIEDLNAIDNGRNIINIVSADILDKPHPNSFQIDARDGRLAAVESELEHL